MCLKPLLAATSTSVSNNNDDISYKAQSKHKTGITTVMMKEKGAKSKNCKELKSGKRFGLKIQNLMHP